MTDEAVWTSQDRLSVDGVWIPLWDEPPWLPGHWGWCMALCDATRGLLCGHDLTLTLCEVPCAAAHCQQLSVFAFEF